jgi:hypothetical protein
MNDNGTNGANGSNWQTIIPLETLGRIRANLDGLINRSDRLQAQIDALTEDGCIWGHLVEEWRGANGPYYRLTFYTDPETGVKPDPVYVGRDAEKVERVRKQIANYSTRAELQRIAAELDRTLHSARQRVGELDTFLEHKSQTYQQLPLEIGGLK